MLQAAEDLLFRDIALGELALYDQEHNDTRQGFGLPRNRYRDSRARDLLARVNRIESSPVFQKALQQIPVSAGPELVANARMFAKAIDSIYELPIDRQGFKKFKCDPKVDISLL